MVVTQVFVKLFVIFAACAEQVRVGRERNVEARTQPEIYHVERGDPYETNPNQGSLSPNQERPYTRALHLL